MALWLKRPEPGPSPPPPKRTSAAQLEVYRMAARANPGAPLNAYLAAHLPQQEFDRWLQPLPLSIVQQDRLDRMMAVLKDPINRGRKLLLAGMLDTLECDALREGVPKAYEILRSMATHEMVEAGPPLPQWSEAVLGVLFGRDAAHVFVEEKHPEKKDGSPNVGNKMPAPTPSEQRDNVQRG